MKTSGASDSRHLVTYPGIGLHLIAWTTLGTLSYVRAHADAPLTRIHDYLAWLACYLPWVALAPLVFRLERRYPLERERWARNLVVLVAASAVFCYAASVMSFGLGNLWDLVFQLPVKVADRWGEIAGTGPWWSQVLSALKPQQEWWLQQGMYWLAVAGGWALRNMMDAQRAEAERTTLLLEKSQLEASLRQAELETLRMRLNPHFLFNTLQNISVLTQHDPQTASAMLTRLGDLLRSALRGDAQAEIPLETELKLAEAYVAVEKMRFGDRLNVVFAIEPGTEHALVPAMLLQPLVENAIKHGINGLERQGEVVIRSEAEGKRLILTVSDNGRGFAGEGMGDVAMGIGLGSTSKRLERLYPEFGGPTMRRVGGDRTEVRVVLPYRAGMNGAREHERTAIAYRG